jgi:transposase-like protein
MTTLRDTPTPQTPPDLTLDEIMARFSTDEAAREYLELIRWPNGPVCPHCGNGDRERIYDIAPNPARKIRHGLRDCAECHSQFTVTVGTIFEDSKIPLRKWLVAWYMLCSSKKGVAALQIQRQLDIGSYRSAWFMMHRIRYALRDPVFADKLGGAGGVVEVDETYVGGKPRPEAGAEKLKRGRGTKKTPVVTLVERGGRARSKMITGADAKTLKAAIRATVDPSARIMTDEWPSYRGIGAEFAGGHDTVNHSAGEYARGDAHVNSAEGYFALLKRGIVGIYHHVGTQYLDQYLAEFDFRYSERSATDGARLIAGIRKIDGKRLMLRRSGSER